MAWGPSRTGWEDRLGRTGKGGMVDGSASGMNGGTVEGTGKIMGGGRTERKLKAAQAFGSRAMDQEA